MSALDLVSSMWKYNSYRALRVLVQMESRNYIR